MDLDRMDRQITMMREFLMADCRDSIVETQQKLDEAAAGDNELWRRHLERRLDELKETLQRCEAELRTA